MARTGFLAAAGVTGAAALAGLGILWWQHRYDEPFQEPDFTGRVVAVDLPDWGRPLGRSTGSVLVVPDAGVVSSRRVSVTIRRGTVVRGPDGEAGQLAPGQRVRVWGWAGLELSNGTLVFQPRFVSIVPDP